MSQLRDETLSDLLKALWLAKVYLFVGAVIGFAVAALIIVFSVPHKRVVMIVAPASDIITGTASRSFEHTQLSQETIPFLRYLKILTGPNVVKSVMEEKPEIQTALADNRRFTFQKPQNFKNNEDIAAYLSRYVIVKPVGDTPLRTIEFEHSNPVIARELLSQLHNTADHILRKEVMERTENRLEYLKDKLSKTANPEHRQSLTNLLMEQERQSMVLRMDKYYASTLVEPPFIYPKNIWPRKSYIFPISVLIGMLLGWIIFGIVKSYQQ